MSVFNYKNKNIYTQNDWFNFIKDLFSFNNFDPFFSNNFFFYSNVNYSFNFYLNGDYYSLFSRDNNAFMSKKDLPVELKDVVRVELKGISRLLGNKSLDIDSKLLSQLTNTNANIEQKIQDYSTFFDTKKSFNFDIYLHIRDYLLNNISLYDLELEQSWLKDSYLYDVTHHLSSYREDVPSVIFNNVLDYDLSTNTPIILRYIDDNFFFQSDNSAESLIHLATKIHRVDLDNSVLYTKLRLILSTFFSKDSNNYLNLTLNHFHKHKYNSEYIQALYSAFFKDLHWGNLAVINRDISSIFNNLNIEYNGSDVDRSFFTLYLGLDRDVDEDVFLSFFLPEYKFFSYKEGEFYLDEIIDASGKIMDTGKKKENLAFSNLLWPEQVDRNFRDVKTRYETLAFDQRGLRDFSLYFHSDLMECLSFMPVWVLYYLMFSSDVIADINSYIKVNARPLKHFHRNSIDPDSIMGYQWMGSWLTLVPKWYWDRFDPKFIITIAGDNVFINNYWLYDLWLKNTGQSGIFSNTSYFSIFNIAFGSHFIYNFGIFWYYILLLFSIPIFILWFIVLFLSEFDRNTFNFYWNWPQNSRFLSEVNNNKIKFKNRFKLLTIDEVFLFLFEGKGLSSAFPIIKFLVKFYDYFFIKPLNKFIFKFNKLVLNKFNGYKKNLFIYIKDVCFKLMVLDFSLNFYVWKEQLNNHFFYKNRGGNNPFIFFNNRSLFFDNFYDYYYSITKFLKYFAAKEGFEKFFVKVHFNNRITGTAGFNWSVIKKNISFFLDWFPSWYYSLAYEMEISWGIAFSSKNIDYSTLINYFKFNVNSNFYLNLFSNYLNFYFYQLNRLSFNSIFNNFYSNLKIFYIKYRVESSVLDLNMILSRIKSFTSLIFRDINKKNKALFFDINFKSNTLLLSDKHTTFSYSLAQLIKTKLDYSFIKSNYINNQNTFRNSFNGVFKFKNNLSFSKYLSLVYTQNKELLLDRKWVSWYPYEDFYVDHFKLITHKKAEFIKNLKYPIEGSPLDLGVYNTVNIAKGLRYLLAYKNNLKYFIYEDKLPLMLKQKNLIFSQVWRMRSYQLRIAKVLINILNIQLVINSPKQLNYISSKLHRTKTGSFFRKSYIPNIASHRTALWNDRLINFKSLFWWKTWFLHLKVKYNAGMRASPLSIRNLFFLGRTNFRISNFLYLEHISNRLKIYNYIKKIKIIRRFYFKFCNLLLTNSKLLDTTKLVHKYPKIFIKHAELLNKYPKLLNELLIKKSRIFHYPFIIKEYANFKSYVSATKNLGKRYVHPFIVLSNKAYVSELQSYFINQQNSFNSKIFNSLNYSSSILNLLEKKVLNFSHMALTLDKVNFLSFNISNSFERIHLYFNMLNHIFSIIEKSFLYPLMGNILSINTEITGYLFRKFILKLNGNPALNKWLKGSPLLSFNHLFGEYPWFLTGKGFTEWFNSPKSMYKFTNLQAEGSLNTHFLYSSEKTSDYFFSFNKFIEYLTAINDKFLMHNTLTEVYGKSTFYFLLKISDIIQHWVVFIDKKISLILHNFNDVFYNQKFYNNISLNNISNLNLKLNQNIINSTKSLFYKINFKFCFDIFTFYIKDLKFIDVFKNLHSLNYSNLINLITNYLYFPTLNHFSFNNFSSIFLRWNSVFFVDKFIDINYFNSFIFAPEFRIKSDLELITFFNKNKLDIKFVINIFKFNDFLKKIVLSPDFVPLRYLIYTGFFEEFFVFFSSNNLVNRSRFVRPFFFHPEGAYSVLSDKYTENQIVENKNLNINTFNLSLVDENPIEISNNNLALILYDTANENYKLISQNNNNLISLDFLNKEIVLLQEDLYIQQKSESEKNLDSDLVEDLTNNILTVKQYIMPVEHLFSEYLLTNALDFLLKKKDFVELQKLALNSVSEDELPINFDFKKGELAIEELINCAYITISELNKKRENIEWCTLENVIAFYREALINKIFPIYMDLFPEDCLRDECIQFKEKGDYKGLLAFFEDFWVSKFIPGKEKYYFVDPLVLNYLSNDLKREWISFIFVKEIFNLFFVMYDREYTFHNSWSLFYDLIDQDMATYMYIFQFEKLEAVVKEVIDKEVKNYKPSISEYTLPEKDSLDESVSIVDVKSDQSINPLSSLMVDAFLLNQQKQVNNSKLEINNSTDEKFKVAVETILKPGLMPEEKESEVDAKAFLIQEVASGFKKHTTLDGKIIFLKYTTLDGIVLFDDRCHSSVFLKMVQTKFRESQEKFLIKNNKDMDKDLIINVWRPSIIKLVSLSTDLFFELNKKRENIEWCTLENVIVFYREALIDKILPLYTHLLPKKYKYQPINLLTSLLNFYSNCSKEKNDSLFLDSWIFVKNLYNQLLYKSTTNQIWSMYEFLLNSILKKRSSYAYLMGVKFVEEMPTNSGISSKNFTPTMEVAEIFELKKNKEVVDLFEDKISLSFISTRPAQLQFVLSFIDSLELSPFYSVEQKQIWKKAYMNLAEVSNIVQKELDKKRENIEWCTLENVIVFYREALIDKILPIYMDLIELDSKISILNILNIIETWNSPNKLESFKRIKNLFYKLIIRSESIVDFNLEIMVHLLEQLIKGSIEGYNNLISVDGLKKTLDMFEKNKKWFFLFEDKISLEFLSKQYLPYPSFLFFLNSKKNLNKSAWKKAYMDLADLSYNVQIDLYQNMDNIDWYTDTQNVLNFYKLNLINKILPIYISLFSKELKNIFSNYSNCLEFLIQLYSQHLKIDSALLYFIKNLFYRLIFRSRYDNFYLRVNLLIDLIQQKPHAFVFALGIIPPSINLFEKNVYLDFLRNKTISLRSANVVPDEGFIITLWNTFKLINKSDIMATIKKLEIQSLWLDSQLGTMQHDIAWWNLKSVYIYYDDMVRIEILPIYLNLLNLNVDQNINLILNQLYQIEHSTVKNFHLVFIFLKNLYYKLTFRSTNDNFLSMFSLVIGLLNNDYTYYKNLMSDVPAGTIPRLTLTDTVSLQNKNKVEFYKQNWLLQISNIVNFLNKIEIVFKDFMKSSNNLLILDFQFLSHDYKIFNYIEIYENLLKINSFWFAEDVNVTTLHKYKETFSYKYIKGLFKLLSWDNIEFMDNYLKLTEAKDFVYNLYLKFLNHFRSFYKKKDILSNMCKQLLTGSKMLDCLLIIYNGWFNIFSYILNQYRKDNNFTSEVMLFTVWYKFLFKLSLFCKSFFIGVIPTTLDGNVINLKDDHDYFNMIITVTYWYKLVNFDNWYLILEKFPSLFLNPLPKGFVFNYRFYPDFFKRYNLDNILSKEKFDILFYNFLVLNGIELSSFNNNDRHKNFLLSFFLFSGLDINELFKKLINSVCRT